MTTLWIFVMSVRLFLDAVFRHVFESCTKGIVYTRDPAGKGSSTDSEEKEGVALPVVYVQGLMARIKHGGAIRESVPFQSDDSNSDWFVVQLSPYASSHDRAVELFYQLKGGRVDFGELHSRSYGHQRFGRTYAPALPNWDRNQPIVLVTHSHGGNTARMLQHLLHIGFFPQHQTSADWVRGIVAIAAPLNGCPVLHRLGMPIRKTCGGVDSEGVERGQATGRVSLVRVGQTIGYCIHWMLGDFAWAKSIYDWGLDHWGITRSTAGWWCLAQLLWGSHRILNTDDTAGYELTVDGAAKLNSIMKLHTCTYYFSVPCHWTTEVPQYNNRALPKATPAFWLIPLGLLGLNLLQYERPTCRPQASDGSTAEWEPQDWRESDLLVPTHSQTHPHVGAMGMENRRPSWERLHKWPSKGLYKDAGKIKCRPGVWYVLPMYEIDHHTVTLFPHPLSDKLQLLVNCLTSEIPELLTIEQTVKLHSFSSKPIRGSNPRT